MRCIATVKESVTYRRWYIENADNEHNNDNIDDFNKR